MANIYQRLNQLRARRVGDDRPNRTFLSANAALEELVKGYSPSTEKWEKSREAKPFTAYALGAMQEVGPDYTRISIEEAERVGKALVPKLAQRNISAEYRLQGSVPLNVHIRKVSDVDLLMLDTRFKTYDRHGPRAAAGAYLYQPALSSAAVLSVLRSNIVSDLEEAFRAAHVDCSGGKAVTISGASLRRVVDVVPSHWHDTVAFQYSGIERDRGVTILDAKTMSTIDNLPFQHIYKVGERCDSVYGGLRKAIRLCKQVKADREAEKRPIFFPSFDIAATMYHADMGKLRLSVAFDLAVLAETQRFLDYLHFNKEYAKTLLTPDGLRRIFDDPKKLDGLTSLSVEMDELLKQVGREHGLNPAEPASTHRDKLQFLGGD